MKLIEEIRKNAWILIVPLTWLAFYKQFGLDPFQDKLIGSIFGRIYILEYVSSIIAIFFGLLISKAVIEYIEVYLIRWFLPLSALLLIVFGISGCVVYATEHMLIYPEVNIYWCFAALAAGSILLDSFKSLQEIRHRLGA